MYQIGEKVIYAKMGVCDITDIVVPSFCEPGQERPYYVLTPVSQSGAIFVPVDANVYMRRVLTHEEADRLIDMIPNLQANAYDNANLQELRQHYADAMESHNCGDLIELLMSIYAKKQARQKNNKKIGAVDEATMKQAEMLLNNEFSVALSIPAEAVPKYIAKRLRSAKASAAGC